jgi:hypothetical protein
VRYRELIAFPAEPAFSFHLGNCRKLRSLED